MAIGTTAAIMAGASAVGGLAQAGAARSATRAQTAAANQQLALQEHIYKTCQEELDYQQKELTIL